MPRQDAGLTDGEGGGVVQTQARSHGQPLGRAPGERNEQGDPADQVRRRPVQQQIALPAQGGDSGHAIRRRSTRPPSTSVLVRPERPPPQSPASTRPTLRPRVTASSARPPDDAATHDEHVQVGCSQLGGGGVGDGHGRSGGGGGPCDRRDPRGAAPLADDDLDPLELLDLGVAGGGHRLAQRPDQIHRPVGHRRRSEQDLLELPTTLNRPARLAAGCRARPRLPSGSPGRVPRRPGPAATRPSPRPRRRRWPWRCRRSARPTRRRSRARSARRTRRGSPGGPRRRRRPPTPSARPHRARTGWCARRPHRNRPAPRPPRSASGAARPGRSRSRPR